MQTIRGTKDILPNEIAAWQDLYLQALRLLTIYNYHEIRTPIIENTEVFLRSVGSSTDIISKEMYRFIDQGQRDVSLRPEGTAPIARAIVSHKLYNTNPIQRLWYMGPMFRYERPQQGRQRQFHQFGLECIGSDSPIADVEVINIAHTFLKNLKYENYTMEINSLGTIEERKNYEIAFTEFLQNYKNDLDYDSQERLETNPLRILDSKNTKTQNLIKEAPSIESYLQNESKEHFEMVLDSLRHLEIPYKINTKLVRGLDYYNHTAFEIINNDKNNKKTVCGGGRYNNLIKQFGGPDISGVGWAIGIERLMIIIDEINQAKIQNLRFEIITSTINAQKSACQLSKLLAEHKIMFNFNLSNQNVKKQIKKAAQNESTGCIIIGEDELKDQTLTVKWLNEHYQETIPYDGIINYLQNKIQKLEVYNNTKN